VKLVVYTAIAADYDRLRPVRVQSPGVDYVCFTEPGKPAAAGWIARSLPRLDLPPQSENRYAKFHPHLLFPDHDASIYIDGNIEIVGDMARLARIALQRARIALYDHPVRTSTFEEAIECALVGFDLTSAIRRQIRRYFADGFAFEGGLLEGNVIVRAHHDPSVVRAMTRWWSEWQVGVKRDQLSLMYVLWKEQLQAGRLGRHDARFLHDYFVYHAHRRKLGRGPLRSLLQVVNRVDLALFGLRVRPR
jgi:hypothetical protein